VFFLTSNVSRALAHNAILVPLTHIVALPDICRYHIPFNPNQ
jgi:hypothetical protein